MTGGGKLGKKKPITRWNYGQKVDVLDRARTDDLLGHNQTL